MLNIFLSQKERRTIMIVFDKFNPIKKSSSNSRERYLEITKEIPTLKNLILVYKHAEQENRFSSESKTLTDKDKDFIKSLISDEDKFCELGKELVKYCDAIINEKCTYTRDPKYKNMEPFFNALFNELKKDSLILYMYLPDLAASDSKLKSSDELMELYRKEFVTWCKNKFPTNIVKKKVYKYDMYFGYVLESCVYTDEDEDSDATTYRQFDKYLKDTYNAVYEHINTIKAKYAK